MKNNLIISMSKFLFIYYNFEGEVIHKLTHKQLNAILSIGNISNNKITMEDVLSGDVLLVRDSEGTVQGYKNPLIDKKDIINSEPVRVMLTFDEDHSINMEDITDYSDYELVELIKECKKMNNDKDKNTVIKELKRRDHEEHKTKEQKLEKIRKREYRKDLI